MKKISLLMTIVFLITIHPAAAMAVSFVTVLEGGAAIATIIGGVVNLSNLFGSSAPNPLMAQIASTPLSFDMVIVGGAINNSLDRTVTIQGGEILPVSLPGGGSTTQNVPYWETLLHLDLVNGAINDRMSIYGSVQHVIAPHPGEAPKGPPLPFNLTLSADTNVSGPQSRTVTALAVDMQHNLETGQVSGHDDILRPVTIAANIDRGVFLDDITGFNIEVHAIHTPEPSTLVFVVTGLACFLVMFYARYRKALPRVE